MLFRSRGSNQALIDLGGQQIPVKTGEWSKWVYLDFKINFIIRVHGMVQLLLMNANNELQLYVSPVTFRPDNPPTPMSYPESFAGEIFKSMGPYRTLGWAEATWPLNENRMDEGTFMADMYKAFDDRAHVILNRLAANNWDVLVGVIEATDRHHRVPVVLTPAQHWSARTATDALRSLWGGFAVLSPDCHLFFAGDTAYSPDFQDIRQHFAHTHTVAHGGGFDLALGLG